MPDVGDNWRLAVWALLGLAVAMRLCFHLRQAQRGEALLPDAGAVRREGRLSLAVRSVGFVLMLAFFVLYGVDAPSLRFAAVAVPAPVRWAGLLLGLGSLGLWTWTHLALGRYWSAQLTLRTGHQLVTAGPYRRVRHPMYTAVFIWVTCLAIVAANWLFLLLAAAIIAVLMARVPKEEQMLLQALGPPYRDYLDRTGRYFPKMRRDAGDRVAR